MKKTIKFDADTQEITQGQDPDSDFEIQIIKKPRGRPPKSQPEQSTPFIEVETPAPKPKGRGRPKKVVEEDTPQLTWRQFWSDYCKQNKGTGAFGKGKLGDSIKTASELYRKQKK